MSTSSLPGRDQTGDLASKAVEGRVLRLLQFLREIVTVRTEPVLQYDDHLQVQWMDDESGADRPRRSAGAGDIIFRASKVEVDDAPVVPRVLAGLIDPAVVADSRYRALELLDAAAPATVADREKADVDVDFDVRKAYEIRQEFAAFSTVWRRWAETDRKRRPQASLYQTLQLMMQELASRPESVEVVAASGLLMMPATEDNAEVRTHLVAQPVTIERDVRTGDLLVKLAAGSHPRLEDTQLLAGVSGFDASGSIALQQSISGSVSSPLDPAAPAFLSTWAKQALGVDIDVADDMSRPTTFGAATLPTVVFAPALVMRTRDSFALLDYYEKMIAGLEESDSPIPLGLAQLVEAIEPEDRLAWLARTGAADAEDLTEDPLFPLPANAEQSQIIHRLGRDSGVVVEGPPGTGKTHTIANLVSSLLARGQRVLVTSEKSQALRVLRDKLPVELQELCVSITDLSRGGSEELSRSVSRIADRKAAYNDVDEAKKIESLQIRRTEAVAKRAVLLDAVSALRAAEAVVHPYISEGFDGTPAAVVRRVVASAESHEWIPGPLFADRPPLSGAEVDRLRKLVATAPEGRAARSHQALPPLESILPNSAALRLLCQRASAAVSASTEQTSQLVDFLAGVDPAEAYDIRRLCEGLDARVREVQELDAVYRQLTDSVLSGDAAHLWSRVSGIVSTMDVAAKSDRFVGAHEVQSSVVNNAALQAMESLAVALESGLEWKPRFRKSEQQRAVEDMQIVATVDGVPATSATTVRLVTEHLRALVIVNTAAVLLADLRIAVATDGSRSRQVNDLQKVTSKLVRVAGALHARDALVERLYAVSPSAPWIRSLDDATQFAGAAGAIAKRIDADVARGELEVVLYSVATQLDSGPSPEGTALVTALSTADADAVQSACDAYALACREQEDQRDQDQLSSALSEIAPALFDLVVETAGDSEWDELSWQLSKAWAWRRAREWVDEQHEEGREHRLDAEIDAVEADLAYLTSKLSAALAWRDCLERMSAVEVRALQTYREHISAIGAGAGRYAETFRSAARSAMRDAQSAVPAWVMPLQQVLASIPPVADSFDVVIVDEASQADISSLFLLYLAPRVIVVGDDRQCAPVDVPQTGTLEDVFTRLDLYLPDLPEHVRATLTPRSSLFSMLRTRFGQVVRLREHFRSMPEIINWSSQQFYADSPLVPVRQFGADRLPPLRHTFVSDATVVGKGSSLVNHAEALAIVGQVVKCLADPQYEGKTFGVVVLQGTSQVDEIRNELIKRIGIDQWEDRRLRVGTPPDFQGDERSVVFLSMVVAPNQAFVALTANQYKRRFNVAASRAQDQLWLFHSVSVDRLKRADLRNSLLSYMTSASPSTAPPMPEAVMREPRHQDFASLFEQHIFLELRDRGYHVNPGVEINNRRIDLVVTGSAARLAVECDGDGFLSTPERRLADIEREQELKRCGWTFWRVRESVYYLDPVAAMASLWPVLAGAGIVPDSVRTDGAAVRAVEWAPVDLGPAQEELFAEVVLPSAPQRSAAVSDSRGAAWEGWLASSEESADDVAGDSPTDMWSIPADDTAATERPVAPSELPFVSKELPKSAKGLPVNGFHEGGARRRR